MTVDCPHWSDCGITGGGCCAINKFGGRPSHGVCVVCLGGAPEPQPLTPQRIARGVAGIAKAVTGTGGADDKLVAQRTAICQTCENAELVAGTFRRCKLCGCSTWAKVRNVSEKCPVGKW